MIRNGKPELFFPVCGHQDESESPSKYEEEKKGTGPVGGRFFGPHLVAQLLSARRPLGTAVRVLDTALRSRRSAALLYSTQSTLRPPSCSISTSTSTQLPKCTATGGEDDHPSLRSLIDARRTQPESPVGQRAASPSHPSPPAVRPARFPPLSAAPGRLVLASFLPGEQFIPWKLDEL